jgi:hypothetical protein
MAQALPFDDLDRQAIAGDALKLTQDQIHSSLLFA